MSSGTSPMSNGVLPSVGAVVSPVDAAVSPGGTVVPAPAVPATPSAPTETRPTASSGRERMCMVGSSCDCGWLRGLVGSAARSGSFAPLAPELIEVDGGDEDGADDDLLEERLEVHDDEPVAQHRRDEHA